jgi:thymidylate synthase (FAD)
MMDIRVKLLHYTPYWVCSDAIRTCWNSFHKRGDRETELELINRIGFKNKHESTLEHITFNFWISGISRGCLQQLVRHRLASYSVQSTRWTLKRLLKSNDIDDLFVHTGDKEVDNASREQLYKVKKLIEEGRGNDLVKYALPESFRTELSMTINLRSFVNFYKLRSNKSSHLEIRHLANLMFEALPQEYKEMINER